MSVAGLLNLNKPAGVTSFDCVRQVRRVLNVKRVGHCGTLDPLAQGVLVILVGEATRYQRHFLEFEKQYWFRAQLGIETDSGDADGKTLSQMPFDHLGLADFQSAVATMIGNQWQIPPRVAAIHYAGRRLYEWARAGVDVPRPPRYITVYRFDTLTYTPPFWEARVVCSSGTYVRSLVHDVCKRLNTVGTVSALVRERVGRFQRSGAWAWSDVAPEKRTQLIEQGLQPCVDLF